MCQMYICNTQVAIIKANLSSATLNHLYPLEIVPRYREPQLEVDIKGTPWDETFSMLSLFKI